MFESVVEEMVALSDQALDDRVRALEVERRRIDAEMAAAVAVADARQLYLRDSHRSMKGYLRATCNWSNSEVGRFRSMARLVDRVDGVGTAWSEGRIGAAQVGEMARAHSNPRVRDDFPAFVPALLEHAELLSFDDFRVCVGRVVAAIDEDGAHRDVDARFASRSVTVKNAGGTLFLNATGGDALVNEEVQAIFDSFVEAEFRRDVAARAAEHGADAEAHPLPRSARQRRYDAFVEILRQAKRSKSPGVALEPTVNVIIDADDFAKLLAAVELIDHPANLLGAALAEAEAGVDPSERRCETSSGVQLHPHEVMRAILAGHVRRVVVDSKGVIVNQGRRQRLFTGAAREAAKLLIRTCTHPGCDLAASICQVDHDTEWNEFGPTDQHNADIRCAAHNRAKYRQRLRTKRGPRGRRYTIRADGTIMLPAGARRPRLIHDADDCDGDGDGDGDPGATRR